MKKIITIIPALLIAAILFINTDSIKEKPNTNDLKPTIQHIMVDPGGGW
ncbi:MULTISPECIES: complement C1q protein [Bacillus cereus group]|nr:MULTISPECIES: complement C1q protein [Bacillus cereus group]MCP1398598.1 YbbR domain-containing protein [Bacillus cereus]MEC2259177.1 complement C1q protein [Bacillus cereus]MED3057438.1 complement C1q protein [Bacillus thuringiensis]OBW88355.1 complement C1q protein [Bacillus cereus]PER54946.1 complement C1q protein [Bacillus thuringiensis]